MGPYLLTTVAAIILVALSGGALSWDGSYHLVKMLDAGAPFLPHGRLGIAPFHWTVLTLGSGTEDLASLGRIYGLVFAAVPVAAIVSSWLVVRRSSPLLFVWVAMGIGLGLLPGLFPLYSEANLAIELFWPILLVLLVGPRLLHLPLLLLCSAAIFFLHPFAIALFGFATLTALALALRFSEREWQMVGWTVLFGALTGLAAYRFMVFQSSYETERLSLEVLRGTFDLSVAGLPEKALALVFLASFMVALGPLLEMLPGKTLPRGLTLVAFFLEILYLAAAGWVFLLWARDPHQWAHEIEFRTWALFTSLPFMLMALLEALIHGRRWPRVGEHLLGRRSLTAQMSALILLVVLSIQSLLWLDITDELKQTLASTPLSWISRPSIAWVQDTPVDHWSITPLSLVVQGRAPQKVIFENDVDGEADFYPGLRLASWDIRGWVGGWFHLEPMGSHLVEEQRALGGRVSQP